MKYQVHCAFHPLKKKKKIHLLWLMDFSLACQAGIKISLKSSFAWFMCQADMSWISLQKGPEIRHAEEARASSPQENLWLLPSSTLPSLPSLYKN